MCLEKQLLQGNYTVLCVEFNVVTATVDMVQCCCVVCGVNCGYSESSYREMLLGCVEFIPVTSK